MTRERVDVRRAQAIDGVGALLRGLGFEHAEDEGLHDTPRRVADALLEMTRGYNVDPGELLGVTFSEKCEDIVALAHIPFVSLCEHHLLPFVGHAGVAYIPSRGRVVGLSKLARLVDCYAKRLQLQERMTNQIADAIQTHLDPVAVAVVVEAEHQCMACRGASKPGAVMLTSSMHGSFRDKPAARHEVLQLLRG